MNQGQKANETGQRLEDVIYDALCRAGYSVKRQVSVCESIYSLPRRRIACKVDLVVQGVPDYPNGLIVEAKYQKERGTNDHKLVYLVTNIEKKYPMPTIVILEGPGFSAGARHWIRQQVGGKLQAVMSIQEFLIWLAELSSEASAQMDLFTSSVVVA